MEKSPVQACVIGLWHPVSSERDQMTEECDLLFKYTEKIN